MAQRHTIQNANICSSVNARQLGGLRPLQFTRNNYVNSDFVRRLDLEKELQGHEGCVNCIQWNESGTLLASGSDDHKLIVWDAFAYKKRCIIRTAHLNNIFAVQFVPETGDALLLSAAGDGRARLHDVHRAAGDECVQVYACHSTRVKRLAVTPAEPHLFWTAGEDGFVMQFDVREAPACMETCSHSLVNLNTQLGSDAEVKCIALNRCRPHLLAVGANDPFARVFDRRCIRTQSVRRHTVADRFAHTPVDADFSLSDGAAQYYCAAHLPLKRKDFLRRYRPLAATHLTFSPCGNDLLVNLGGEQIYMFGVNDRTSSELEGVSRYFNQPAMKSLVERQSQNGHTNGHTVATNGYASWMDVETAMTLSAARRHMPAAHMEPLPRAADALKVQANEHFTQQRYSLAVALYSQAIELCSGAAVLYANRAAAYMRRNWDGDVYAAVRDCLAVLRLDPGHAKALFRLARGLNELGLSEEAQACTALFKLKFPDQATSPSSQSLDSKIKAELASKADSDAALSSSNGGSKKRSKRPRMPSPPPPPPQRAERRSRDAAAESSEVDAHLMSPTEMLRRMNASDYAARFCGHCNTTTDIKEANFFGSRGELVVAGSDDGSFFVWHRHTCNIAAVLRGDDSIVNCLQPHPTECLLATSGIESVVKLWSPRAEVGESGVKSHRVDDHDQTASANQRRMNADPVEVMLMNIGYRLGYEADADADNSAPTVQCRQS